MATQGLKLCNILKKTIPASFPKVVLTQTKNYSYQASKFLEDIEVNTKYEVTKNPEDWKYVDRILPPILVPDPKPKSEYPSGWKPQGENFDNQPYFVKRTKNHMMPVYLITNNRGIIRRTLIKNIQGDIWQLEKELKPFLEDVNKPKPLLLQVNEFRGHILMKGDFVNAIKHWMAERNF